MRQRDDAHLAGLLSKVNLARTDVRADRNVQRTTPTSRDAHRVRCAALAEAMEAYADAASDAGVPLPYRYRDEMRLYRSMASR
jgi:hypothetical protein